ncbi:MAG: PAS/PAC sensor signal transduction histidine kinase [Candidatus Peregrinibacteria bacterium GW2011_GWA2_33_10]|nr:MAG: PAS/PAC sensor signal transduction histidine kinase [Candidatus Peregrinibacteria bacterium GW2011_GWA2_33_10]KKP40892.1 MAG: hypothetical protein UR30_C0003G0064 [Candidatus Peregrinibacteria bacterium GW2011_GWC2_33_13]OGJ47348.1 MAG: hypothetical protein A2229_05175 [Candidatus Peregrinibacteria bacterium RIFOXYA2_FULL_33_7]
MRKIGLDLKEGPNFGNESGIVELTKSGADQLDFHDLNESNDADLVWEKIFKRTENIFESFKNPNIWEDYERLEHVVNRIENFYSQIKALTTYFKHKIAENLYSADSLNLEIIDSTFKKSMYGEILSFFNHDVDIFFRHLKEYMKFFIENDGTTENDKKKIMSNLTMAQDAMESLKYWYENQDIFLKICDINVLFSESYVETLCKSFGNMRVNFSIFHDALKDKSVIVNDSIIRNLIYKMIHNAQFRGKALNVNINVVLNGTDMKIVVEDDGIGIDPEISDRVYEKGVSGYGSTGYGLRDADKKVEFAGGRLIKHDHGGLDGSEVKKGAKLEIVLPLEQKSLWNIFNNSAEELLETLDKDLDVKENLMNAAKSSKRFLEVFKLIIREEKDSLINLFIRHDFANYYTAVSQRLELLTDETYKIDLKMKNDSMKVIELDARLMKAGTRSANYYFNPDKVKNDEFKIGEIFDDTMIAGLVKRFDEKEIIIENLDQVKGLKIFGNRYVLENMFFNMARNSFKHGGEKCDKCKFKFSIDGAANNLIIEIFDNGKGVNSKLKDNLFDLGVTDGDGTGMGLANIKCTIEAEMKGSIKCIPNGGDYGGAYFKIELPFRKESLIS